MITAPNRAPASMLRCPPHRLTVLGSHHLAESLELAVHSSLETSATSNKNRGRLISGFIVSKAILRYAEGWIRQSVDVHQGPRQRSFPDAIDPELTLAHCES